MSGVGSVAVGDVRSTNTCKGGRTIVSYACVGELIGLVASGGATPARGQPRTGRALSSDRVHPLGDVHRRRFFVNTWKN